MSGATLSQERFLLECARQERLEREAEASRMAFAEALAAARREGAQEMRERAAQVVEDYFNPETCSPCAAAIRALVITPEEL